MQILLLFLIITYMLNLSIILLNLPLLYLKCVSCRQLIIETGSSFMYSSNLCLIRSIFNVFAFNITNDILKFLYSWYFLCYFLCSVCTLFFVCFSAYSLSVTKHFQNCILKYRQCFLVCIFVYLCQSLVQVSWSTGVLCYQ